MKKISMILSMILLCAIFASCSAGMQETSAPAAEVTTEPIQTVAQDDPAEDDELCVLLIGNSFSCGFPDELNGMLKKADIKARIYTVFSPGCTVQQHWRWFDLKQANYSLRYFQQKSIMLETLDVDLEYCLAQQNWDVIAIQQHFNPPITQTAEEALDVTTGYAKNLFDHLKENYPKSKLVWYETWAYEVGWENADLIDLTVDEQIQKTMQDNIHTASVAVAEENGVAMVPCGGAWDIARTEYNAGVLTSNDLYHDGETAGGQYLNACVWFEYLTGKSCVGNFWRPQYTLGEDRVKLLQEAAHKAVAENPVK